MYLCSPDKVLFFLFVFFFLLRGGDGGRVDLCSSETNKQLNPDLSDSRFLRRGPVGGLLADIARGLFTTWQQGNKVHVNCCQLSGFSKKQTTVLKMTFPSCVGSENVIFFPLFLLKKTCSAFLVNFHLKWLWKERPQRLSLSHLCQWAKICKHWPILGLFALDIVFFFFSLIGLVSTDLGRCRRCQNAKKMGWVNWPTN